MKEEYHAELKYRILHYASFGANRNAAKTGIISNPVGFGRDWVYLNL